MEVLNNSSADDLTNNEKQICDDDFMKTEPAVLISGPQDTTALVGDRVLLKATYMGHPEPSVKWTRAVSYFNFDGIFYNHKHSY